MTPEAPKYRFPNNGGGGGQVKGALLRKASKPRIVPVPAVGRQIWQRSAPNDEDFGEAVRSCLLCASYKDHGGVPQAEWNFLLRPSVREPPGSPYREFLSEGEGLLRVPDGVCCRNLPQGAVYEKD